jgi:hypothetical protein
VFAGELQRRTGKVVCIFEVPTEVGVGMSKSGFSSSTIYAFMRPGATEEEIIHELLHSEIALEGFVAANATGQEAGTLSNNLQDFMIHPLLEKRAADAGFPQDRVIEQSNKSLKEDLLVATEPAEASRLEVATNALALAMAQQDKRGPITEIAEISAQRLPQASQLAATLVSVFPRALSISPASSYARARRILEFLDRETQRQTGRKPSTYIRLHNPLIEPTLTQQEEAVIRQYLTERKQSCADGVQTN